MARRKVIWYKQPNLLIEAIQPLPFYRVLNVNALSLNNAGAYISQELGYALAWGNEYMGQLTDAGIPAAIVAKKIKFNFGISSNYFLEIAKFRAARLLWANIVASYNPECVRDCENKGPNGECRCAAKNGGSCRNFYFQSYFV